MQGKPRKSKQKAAFIYKPYLKGNWRSVLAAKRSLRILVYQVAFMEDRLGYASAMSIALMLIIGLFTLVQFKLSGGGEQDYE